MSGGKEGEGKGPRTFVTFRGYPNACRRIGFDPRGCWVRWAPDRPSARARTHAPLSLVLTLNNARMVALILKPKKETACRESSNPLTRLISISGMIGSPTLWLFAWRR